MNKYIMESQNAKNWDDLNLKDEILRGIYSHGFESPSPIQARAIGPIVSEKDVIAQAQSGTGKTGTFSISCLQRIDETKKEDSGINNGSNKRTSYTNS